MKKLVMILALQISLVACGPQAKMTSSAVSSSSVDTTSSDSLSNLKAITASQASTLMNEFIPQVAANGGDNRYSTALFGLARDMNDYGNINISFEQANVPTSYLTNGGLPVQFHRSKNKKAPLAIILNPLFSGEIENQMARYKKYYGDKDFHVLVFINTWSPEFIAKVPTFMPGDIWSEGKMHIEVINRLINELIGKENVDGVTMIGLSYGAFMSAIVKYYDAKSAAPVITGPTVIVSPPHDIFNSLKNVDRQTTEINAWVDGALCLLSGGLYSVVAEAATKNNYNDTHMDEKCAKYLFVTVGFTETLKNSIRKINESKHLGLTDAYINAITYQKYMKEVAKLNPSAQETDLGYWMSEAKKTGYDKFVVMTSKDDSINEGNSLPSNQYFKFYTTNLFYLPTGGHTGFREAKSTNLACSHSWELCVLKAIYND